MPRVTNDAGRSSLVELRVLEGPNLYFPRAAIKLTLDISALAGVPTDKARRFAGRIGLRNAIGTPSTPPMIIAMQQPMISHGSTCTPSRTRKISACATAGRI